MHTLALLRALLLSGSVLAYPIGLVRDNETDIVTHGLLARADPSALPLDFPPVGGRSSARVQGDVSAPNPTSKSNFQSLYKLADENKNPRGKVIGIKISKEVRLSRPIKVSGTKKAGDEKVVFGSSSGEWIPFGNTRRTMRVTGMHGCTLGVVLTEKGVWAGHFWEDESTPGKGGCFREALEDTGVISKTDFELDEDTDQVLKDKNGKPIPKTEYQKQDRDPKETFVLIDGQIKKLTNQDQNPTPGWESLADSIKKNTFLRGNLKVMILTKSEGVKNVASTVKDEKTGKVSEVSKDGVPKPAPMYPAPIDKLRGTFATMCDKGKCLRNANELDFEWSKKPKNSEDGGCDEDELTDMLKNTHISDDKSAAKKPAVPAKDRVKVVTYIGEPWQSGLELGINGVTIIDYSPHHRTGDKGGPLAGVNVWVEGRPKPEVNMEWDARPEQRQARTKRRALTAGTPAAPKNRPGGNDAACKAKANPKSPTPPAGQTTPKPSPSPSPNSGAAKKPTGTAAAAPGTTTTTTGASAAPRTGGGGGGGGGRPGVQTGPAKNPAAAAKSPAGAGKQGPAAADKAKSKPAAGQPKTGAGAGARRKSAGPV